MRKTKLFTLVALSALMAACSQDEFVTPMGDAKVDLANRPVLGDVTIDLGDANTRMAFNGSFNWKFENGDEVGAAIVDAPKITETLTGYVGTASVEWTYAEYVQGVKKEIGGKKYLFTETKQSDAADAKYNTAEDWYGMNDDNHISSNYPYLLKDNKFSSQANLVEGNYLFYAPYDAAHLTREPLVVVTPMVQDCSEAEMKNTNYLKKPATVSSKSLSDFYKGTTKGFEKAIVAVGHKFLAAPADRTQPIEATASMKDVFAYPMFTIANNYNGYLFDTEALSTSVAQKPVITVDSIQIYSTEANKILYKKAIDVDKTAKTLNSADWSAAGKYTSDKSNTAALFAESGTDFDKADYFAATNANVQTKVNLTAINNVIEYKQKHITCDLGGKVLNQGDIYHFHAIMPAENYGHALYAKIFVKIGEKRYVIYNTSVTDAITVDATPASPNYGKATVNVAKTFTDWNFCDVINGNQDARLIRGEHYPAAELLESGNGTKNFAGTMLTINLTGGTTQAAFALTEKSGDFGFETNADFIKYMTEELQRGVDLVEDKNVQSQPRESWKGADGSTVGHFAFATDNTCIINAELIAALQDKMYQNGTTGNAIRLETNLPVAGDVKIVEVGTEDKGYTPYTIQTLDKKASYIVKLKTASAGTDGTALINGINNITSGTNVALKAKSTTKNAVVVLGGTSAAMSATLDNATGISAIYVNDNATLTVNTTCDALVVLDKGSITIGQKGSLTNANNDLKEGTVINTNLKEIAGTVNGEKVTVTATSAAFPTAAIPAKTKVNNYEIAAASKEVVIEQKEIDMFANLSGVTVKITGATGIKSVSNVTLNNIKSFVATSITWNKGGTTSIVITHPKGSTIDAIPGTDVEFVEATGTNE